MTFTTENGNDDSPTLRCVCGALRSAKAAHPEIDYAGLESSIAKRVLGALRGEPAPPADSGPGYTSPPTGYIAPQTT